MARAALPYATGRGREAITGCKSASGADVRPFLNCLGYSASRVAADLRQRYARETVPRLRPLGMAGCGQRQDQDPYVASGFTGTDGLSDAG